MKTVSKTKFQCIFGECKLSVWTISQLILKTLQCDIPIYSSYTCPKYWEFDVINSVKLGTVSGFRNIFALSNAINCNVQPLYPGILTFQWKENTCIKGLDHIPPVIK